MKVTIIKNLSNESLTEEEALLLAGALQRNNYILSLDISINPIGNTGFIALLKACPRLIILDIGMISLTPELSILLQQEQMVRPALQKLRMYENPIGNTGFIALLKVCPGLITLDARVTSLTAELETLLHQEQAAHPALQELIGHMRRFKDGVVISISKKNPSISDNCIDELLMRWTVLTHIFKPAPHTSVVSAITAYMRHPDAQYHPLGKILDAKYLQWCQKTAAIALPSPAPSFSSASSSTAAPTPAATKSLPRLPIDLAPLIYQYLGVASKKRQQSNNEASIKAEIAMSQLERLAPAV